MSERHQKLRLPKYAIIDLSTGTATEYPIPEELYTKYIGGKALGSRLLFDLVSPGADPLSSDNVLIVNTSPMTGTGAASTSRFNLSFKNVLTGGIATSNCGGTFGIMLKAAGYDGIILKGKAECPTYIEIVDGEVSLKNAEHLWGMNTEEVQKQFDPHWGKLVIGPAGENLVRYASAVSGERVAGRCGAGAVMGSKKIKAIIAFGTKKPYIYDKEKFDKYNKKYIHLLRDHPVTGEALPKYGSAYFLKNTNSSHSLPTKNFKMGQFEDAEKITGEALADKFLTRNSGCVSCPIRCERRVMVYGKEVKGPEYETVGLLGANILNNDLDLISELNYLADIYGMDSISLGGTLAFAMELKEKNLADFGLDFGSKEGILEAINAIAHGIGSGKELGQGTKLLADKYGGEDFAIHAKGLELASYEPRTSVGMGLGYATSNRGGCHLNGGYLALVETVMLSVDAQTPKGKAELTVLFQNMIEAISVAGYCLFTAIAVLPGPLLKLGPAHPVSRLVSKILVGVRFVLGKLWKFMPKLLPFNLLYLLPHSESLKLVTGMPMTSGKFLQIGERCFNIERIFNLKEGFTAKDDDLCARLTETPQDPDRPDTIVPLDKMLPKYYKVRGWDKNGVPTKKKMNKLGIDIDIKV
ncbi:MAG: aldehyde ferredoxin oxidoreductase family protein [Clostridiaceae bacterium]|mgnify:CR=1 FL=1|jgi:aldehyde:ferredoxin oxidoreductase|nr:aldehyde ferredoxin oxidoreductase family protein [Clostridiaceae bacterium]